MSLVRFKAVTTSGLVFFGLTGLCAMEVVQSNETEVDGRTVVMEGVCDATENRIDCWHPDGSPHPQLAERIKAHFLNNPQQGFSLKFRKKNRIIVTTIRSAKDNPGFNNYFQLTQADQYINGNDQFQDGGVSHSMYWVATDFSQKGLTLDAHYNKVLAKSVKVKPKVGETCDLQGHTLEIVTVKKIDATDNYNEYGGQGGWAIHYRITPPLPNIPQWGLSFVPLTPKGEMGNAIDKDGKLIVQTNEGNGFYSGGNPNLIQQYGPMGYLRSTADPDSIGSIEITATTQVVVPLTPVKLDPSK